MKRAKDYLAAKDPKKAVIEFKVASQNMPNDAEPVYQLGMTYLGLGNRAQALSAFQKIADARMGLRSLEFVKAARAMGLSSAVVQR